MRKLNDCDCSASTGICGNITRGTGKLDFNGYWSTPCPHGNDMLPIEAYELDHKELEI